MIHDHANDFQAVLRSRLKVIITEQHAGGYELKRQFERCQNVELTFETWFKTLFNRDSSSRREVPRCATASGSTCTSTACTRGHTPAENLNGSFFPFL